MSYIFSRLSFLKKVVGTFSNDHGITTNEDRNWEGSYRKRWQHDKIARSTHGVNCTGSCSWKIYVKNGLITWETQYTDYPRTRSDMPNHEPRGCQRGASFSWYVYSSARLKYPLIRSQLIKLWKEVKEKYDNPVEAWESIQNDKDKVISYKSKRGLGGFVRSTWNEVDEIIAAANIYTIKKYGPDRVIGFSPIPAMSMVSYAAGSRYLSLIGGVCLSFYDWYCDLPPSSPQTWGEQTDVPESADWYNSFFIILWGSNVPQTRTPDAHFFTEVRYKGAKTVVITSDYSEASKLSDIWLAPKAGTDAALAMAMGHVILKEFYLTNEVNNYFYEYSKLYTDMFNLVMIDKFEDSYIPGRFLRASDLPKSLGVKDNADWKTIVFNENINDIAIPNGSIGTRWDGSKLWNLKLNDIRDGSEIKPLMTFVSSYDMVASIGFPYYASSNYSHDHFKNTIHNDILYRNVPIKELKIGKKTLLVTTVFDLLVANYGIDRGLGGLNVASSYEDNIPYTPLWQEEITGVKKEDVISIARQFADNAVKTEGKSMVIIGAAMNHWYNMDMNYRSVINLLIMCGCVGKSGGGWSHYVGQEKLRPLAGWLPLAFSLDWNRPPRLMNGTSFFYNHSSQWKYEKIRLNEILSPTSDKKKWDGYSIIDCNIMSERMGWLPSAPQLNENPLNISKKAEESGKDIKSYVIDLLKNNKLLMACEDPDHQNNLPRNMFIWRSNLLGSSGKGHEYLLKHLLGTRNGVVSENLSELGYNKPKNLIWRDDSCEGKLDLLVTLDFRLSTTCLYSDIVLPTASWYEKDDLNTSDMHPFIHPLSAAIDPVWETRTDWNIYKSISRKFSEISKNYSCFDNIEKDIVLTPLMHDSPSELGQSIDVVDWKNDNSIELIPGKNMPNITIVDRNYSLTYAKFTSLGPLLRKLGNNCKGIFWNTDTEIDHLSKINNVVISDDITNGLPKIDTAIDAAEVILTLAPETNGHVAFKSWKSLGSITGLSHTHLSEERKAELISFRDIQAQPRKIISSPTWSGIESESVSYNSGYTNVHEYIPWRTLTGRQQYYQDHSWMRDFGEALCIYKPPVDTKTTKLLLEETDKNIKQVALNFISPHQKWGIHSTYSDNLLMLTLNRGGPIIWISEIDAKKVDVIDNDWIEAYNINGCIVARAVVSQRVPEGIVLMYHAQEKILNVPLSKNNYRGGIHNSVTRVCPKPTHMIGGYAQQSWGFNYYGTVGSNRDEFIIVRKLVDVLWGNEVNIPYLSREEK